ncbi:glycosyltransferase family 4 protein [Mycobacterium frederiksbergense]|uniref:Glycosyltransferase n=1 Tax=Mycolicibacterium frederiksbergense TaxID=117567 RepID=A0A6H0S0P6_9MYCO|nr:glycosyltransferase family 4 protein [Mycolicibacterium frederiksbergense]MCV7047480.1 glycosyltransferase family 4 protein [Mycolicibacterium frederiksbergense]QIV80780.1 glycosyltransferase [Mycolicibacterium frederiksbergense]
MGAASVPFGEHRLVFVAPDEGQTAVGDYAQDLVTALRPHFGEIVEHRTAGPGQDSLADLRRHRATVRRLVAEGPPGRTLVHAELSTGVLPTFWAVAGLRGVPVTSTIHDPPQGLWFLARTRSIAKSRLLTHGIHYPLRPLSQAIEGRVHGDRALIALTETGRQSIERTYPRTTTFYVPHLVRERPAIRPAEERPKAVGFFGFVYRGKGFEQIARIRDLLPADIAIRVAGRGTEALPRAEGIEILGGVDGPEEDAFFDSVRAIVVPYGKRHFYAETYPASGVVAHAMAYSTPVVCTGYGSLAELDSAHGVLNVSPRGEGDDAVATGLAEGIESLLNDPTRLAELGRNADRTRQERSAERTAEALVQIWTRVLAGQRKRLNG